MKTDITTREGLSRFAAFLDDGDVLRVKGVGSSDFTPGVVYCGTVFFPDQQLAIVHFEADNGEQRRYFLSDVRRWLRDGTLELQQA